MNTDRASLHSRYKLLGLIALFSAPVLIAYGLYFWAPSAWQPEGRTHRGHLISPARPMPALSLHTVAGQRRELPAEPRWTLLMIGSSRCNDVCATTLYNTRQVRTALGKNTSRTRRLYVATDRVGIEALQALVKREHPDLELAVAEGAEVYQIDRFFSAEGRNPLKNTNQNRHDIYLLDPHDNWLMYYTAEVPPQGLLKDLKKLLRLSNIG